ncbi:MAG: glycosyltransferase family 4 protein, partial [Clostridia bacterium]|nr:glycosyltransferase family 4 protein [Clostridia bacterium]
MLEPELEKLGYRPEQGHLIRGAFDVSEFPFCPRQHRPNSEFVIGRLARPDLDKWSSNTWPIYGMVPYRSRKALVMGWNDRLQQKLGHPPEWATCLKPNEIPVQEFLARCHVLMPVNGGARENWPRVGLEAMAAGVPIVTQNQGGWR